MRFFVIACVANLAEGWWLWAPALRNGAAESHLTSIHPHFARNYCGRQNHIWIKVSRQNLRVKMGKECPLWLAYCCMMRHGFELFEFLEAFLKWIIYQFINPQVSAPFPTPASNRHPPWRSHFITSNNQSFFSISHRSQWFPINRLEISPLKHHIDSICSWIYFLNMRIAWYSREISQYHSISVSNFWILFVSVPPLSFLKPSHQLWIMTTTSNRNPK